MKFKEILSDVADFQLASSQTVNTVPTVGDYSEAKLRYELMREENEEYKEANRDEDIVEILDACIDMIYVLAGTINQHGLQGLIEEAFLRVHQNNMTKVIDGKVLRNEQGKIMKPSGFVPVDLTNMF